MLVEVNPEKTIRDDEEIKIIYNLDTSYDLTRVNTLVIQTSKFASLFSPYFYGDTMPTKRKRPWGE